MINHAKRVYSLARTQKNTSKKKKDKELYSREQPKESGTRTTAVALATAIYRHGLRPSTELAAHDRVKRRHDDHAINSLKWKTNGQIGLDKSGTTLLSQRPLE